MAMYLSVQPYTRRLLLFQGYIAEPKPISVGGLVPRIAEISSRYSAEKALPRRCLGRLTETQGRCQNAGS